MPSRAASSMGGGGSLGRTYDVLSAKKWEGADIKDVIDATLEPFASADPDRIRVIGPPVQMSSALGSDAVDGSPRARDQCLEVWSAFCAKRPGDRGLVDQAPRQGGAVLAGV